MDYCVLAAIRLKGSDTIVTESEEDMADPSGDTFVSVDGFNCVFGEYYVKDILSDGTA